MRRLVVAPLAQADIREALRYSQHRHGPRAAIRYRRLIEVAVAELRDDPLRLLSKPAGAGDLRLYALRFAARELDAAAIVRAAPHVAVYRFDDNRVQIVRLLHDAMDLPRHLEALVFPESLDLIRDDRSRDDPEAGGED